MFKDKYKSLNLTKYMKNIYVSQIILAGIMSMPITYAIFDSVQVNVYADSGYAITKGGITGTRVNVRTAANTNSQIHSTLEMGSEINVIGQEGDFYRILVDGNPDLYVTKEFVMLRTGMITTTADNVNIRTGSSTGHAAITRATMGESFITSGQDGDFYVIEHDNDEGKFAYIHKDFVSEVKYHNSSIKEETTLPTIVISNDENVISTAQDNMGSNVVIYEHNKSSEELQYVVTTTDGLRLRTAPSLESDVLTYLPNGLTMALIGENEEWLKVLVNGTEGYISAEFASIKIESHIYADVTDVDVVKAKAIVEYGKKFLGTPYLYAGSDLENGVDCSGFVNAVLTDNGVAVSRNSTTLFYDGVEIGKSDLQMGDLVFFTTDHTGSKSSIAHVGIYIGNGEFIHSSSSEKNWGVTISSLNETYYINNYVSACRVL